MLVPDEFIIEEVDIPERELGQDPPGTHLQYNHTEPSVIRDGIDFITVIDEGDGEYRIDYRGCVFGRMYITADGVQELGEQLLNEGAEIPSWTVDPESVDADDLPWWVPAETTIAPTAVCDNCGETVSVRDVVTPRSAATDMQGAVFCVECWRQR